MTEVSVNVRRGGANGEIDKALRKLKRVMNSAGVLRELKERKFFLKPSEKKRKKSGRARARIRKESQ